MEVFGAEEDCKNLCVLSVVIFVVGKNYNTFVLRLRESCSHCRMMQNIYVLLVGTFVGGECYLLLCVV